MKIPLNIGLLAIALIFFVAPQHAEASPAPNTSTQAASSITATTAILNGTITNCIGCSVRGFAYGINSTLATVIATTTDSVGQPFGAGTFTAAISGLTRGTTYYVRAYATNGTGTGLGAILSFTASSGARIIRLVGHMRLRGGVRLAPRSLP
jgi:hypothetical protein